MDYIQKRNYKMSVKQLSYQQLNDLHYKLNILLESAPVENIKIINEKINLVIFEINEFDNVSLSY
jgi:hypothetical protein